MTGALAEIEVHRPALMAHCYRMLGSVVDADDAVQEALLRAWRSQGAFEGRSSVRTWLFRIATNVCLDALGSRARRVRPIDDRSVGTIDDPLDTRPREHWLEPVPDAMVVPPRSSPAEHAEIRESIRLAFVAALQHLPPRQRAAILLTEVVGWSAAESAECLDMSVAAVNSALQRARATLAKQRDADSPAALTQEQNAWVEQYAAAFEAYDVDRLVTLLHEDAVLSMPPYTLWLRGRDAIRGWFLGRGAECRGSRLIATSACGAPSFGQYRRAPGGGHRAWSLLVLDVRSTGVAAMTAFLDTEALFPRFGLPLTLPA